MNLYRKHLYICSQIIYIYYLSSRMARFVIFVNCTWHPRGHGPPGPNWLPFGAVGYHVLPPGSTAQDARDEVLWWYLWFCNAHDCTPSQMPLRFWWEGVFIWGVWVDLWESVYLVLNYNICQHLISTLHMWGLVFYSVLWVYFKARECWCQLFTEHINSVLCIYIYIYIYTYIDIPHTSSTYSL